MKWSNNLSDINTVVSHLNRGNSNSSDVDIKCKDYFNAINILFNAYILREESDNYKFRETIYHLTDSEQKKAIINSIFFKNLINFKPYIKDDKMLRQGKIHSDNTRIRNEPDRNHIDLINSYNERKPAGTIINNLCKLLYMIRGNLNHGEKTPYGIDTEKVQRDKTVCEMIFPLLNIIMDIILDYPSKKLIVYGTLKKGEINQNIINDNKNERKNIKIFGSITFDEGLSYYNYSLANNDISAELIYKEKMELDFDRLSKFEGESYIKILVPYIIDNEILIGNIFANNKFL